MAGQRIIIVGGGAAGLMAAVQAAKAGNKVIILEKLEQPGSKLLATGGGRCNLSNLAGREDFTLAFGRQGRFMLPALEYMDSQGLRTFFAGLGIPTKTEGGFYVFPACGGARAVLDALLREIGRLGVQLDCGKQVTRLLVENQCIQALKIGQRKIETHKVILAAGGRGYPGLGGTGSGFELAAVIGHKVIQCVPGLVPLITNNSGLHELAGVSVDEVDVRISEDKKSCARGAIIFTHHGLSGPAILNLSAAVASRLTRGKTVSLRIDLLPTLTREELTRTVRGWALDHGKKKIHTLLGKLLPARLARAVCAMTPGTIDTRGAELTTGARQALLDMLKQLPIRVTRTAGFAQAMVTRGGVSLGQVDPRTLQSKLVKGLFFAGEILDLDGPCGGYNLQWAMSSGALAGKNTVGIG